MLNSVQCQINEDKIKMNGLSPYIHIHTQSEINTHRRENQTTPKQMFSCKQSLDDALS